MNYPKSTKDLKKHGTWRKDRHSGRIESTVQLLATVPDPPENFDERHKKKWKSVCKDVILLGVLTEQDFDSLTAYVQAFFISKDAHQDLTKNGLTLWLETKDGARRPITNPAFRQYTDAQKILSQIGDKFGLNPRSRMTLRAVEQSEDEDLGAEFLRN